MSVTPDPPPKANFGRYQLLRRVSVGGTAEVYKAKAFGPHGFEKVVALKRLLPTAEEDPEFVQMFVSEATLAAQLQHRRICGIYELGDVRGAHYIAMEFVYGRTVRETANRVADLRRRMPAVAVAAIALQAAQGLAYAHGFVDRSGRPLRIVHRDVSPQNLMVDARGALKLIDFGIAKFEGRRMSTQTGVLKGKSSYMSPEQVRRQPLDGRSDLFSLGVVLYELLVGRRLFKRDTAVATLEAVKHDPIPALSQVAPSCPAPLAELVHRCLERDLARRIPSAQHLEREVAQVFHGMGHTDPERLLSALYRRLFGEEGSREHEVTLDEYRAALSAAEDTGAETTDRRQVDDATRVYVEDHTDLREYVAGLGARLHRAQPAATPSTDAVPPPSEPSVLAPAAPAPAPPPPVAPSPPPAIAPEPAPPVAPEPAPPVAPEPAPPVAPDPPPAVAPAPPVPAMAPRAVAPTVGPPAAASDAPPTIRPASQPEATTAPDLPVAGWRVALYWTGLTTGVAFVAAAALWYLEHISS